jgi:hypothetical protein
MTAFTLDIFIYWFYPRYIKKYIDGNNDNQTTAREPKLEKDDLALQINSKIQEFRISLVSIKTLQSEPKKQRSVLEDARQTMEEIQNAFSQSEIIFTHRKSIKDVIKKIYSLFEDYRVSVGMLAREEFDEIRTEFTIKKELWGTLGDKNSIEGQILLKTLMRYPTNNIDF